MLISGSVNAVVFCKWNWAESFVSFTCKITGTLQLGRPWLDAFPDCTKNPTAKKIGHFETWTSWKHQLVETLKFSKQKQKKTVNLTLKQPKKKRLKLPETSKSPKFRHPVKLLDWQLGLPIFRCIVRCFSGVNVEENVGKPHYKKQIHLPNLICFRGFSRWSSRIFKSQDFSLMPEVPNIPRTTEMHSLLVSRTYVPTFWVDG